MKASPSIKIQWHDMSILCFPFFSPAPAQSRNNPELCLGADNLTSTRIMRSSGVKAKTPRQRPLLFNACCPHESAPSPTPPRPHSAESWEVLREGEDGLQVSSPKALFLSLAPQGEHPINPTVFVQRQIASFECQWTRRPLLERDWLHHVHTHTHTCMCALILKALGQARKADNRPFVSHMKHVHLKRCHGQHQYRPQLGFCFPLPRPPRVPPVQY